MNMTIKSIKVSESFVGDLDEAIERAREIEEEYRPAWGVQVVDDAGNIIFDTED